MSMNSEMSATEHVMMSSDQRYFLRK